MAFGYDQSYVICFCGDWDFTTKFKCNLKGHYPDLENFIKDNKSMRVVVR
jgi:hypothetical protein